MAIWVLLILYIAKVVYDYMVWFLIRSLVIMVLWVIGSACRRDAIRWEVAWKTFSETTVTECKPPTVCCLFRIHVTWSCKDLFYNRQIKTTYFPGLDIYSGDAERRSKTARSLLTKQPSNQKVDKSKGTLKSRPKQWAGCSQKRGLIRKPSKRVVASSRALSSGGGPAYPPNAPQKSGELV